MGDAVLSHLASKVAPGIDVVFLDTGYHFAETIGTRDAVEATMPVNLITITPCSRSPSRTRTYGKDLFKRDPDLCCALRKVQPLAEAPGGVRRLGDRPAPRRDPQPGDRAGRRLGREEAARSRSRRWPAGPTSDVERYIAENGVLVNPLAVRRLPLHRLLAVHPARRARRGRPQRPLGRHQQDRVRHPLMTSHGRQPPPRTAPTTTCVPTHELERRRLA